MRTPVVDGYKLFMTAPGTLLRILSKNTLVLIII